MSCVPVIPCNCHCHRDRSRCGIVACCEFSGRLMSDISPLEIEKLKERRKPLTTEKRNRIANIIAAAFLTTSEGGEGLEVLTKLADSFKGQEKGVGVFFDKVISASITMGVNPDDMLKFLEGEPFCSMLCENGLKVASE